MAEIEVKLVEAHRFALSEGDKLVLKIPDEMADDAEHIATQVAGQFPGYPLLVLCGEIDLSVLPAQPEAPVG